MWNPFKLCSFNFQHMFSNTIIYYLCFCIEYVTTPLSCRPRHHQELLVLLDGEKPAGKEVPVFNGSKGSKGSRGGGFWPTVCLGWRCIQTDYTMFLFVDLCHGYFVWFDAAQTHPMFVVCLKTCFSFLHISKLVFAVFGMCKTLGASPLTYPPWSQGVTQSLHHRQILEHLDNVLIKSDMAMGCYG